MDSVEAVVGVESLGTAGRRPRQTITRQLADGRVCFFVSPGTYSRPSSASKIEQQYGSTGVLSGQDVKRLTPCAASST